MKTRVISFRVREDEYEALKAYSFNWFDTLSEFIDDRLTLEINKAMEEMAKERKRAEAKAKRDAKKAAANGAQ
jgi:hypothetical protein